MSAKLHCIATVGPLVIAGPFSLPCGERLHQAQTWISQNVDKLGLPELRTSFGMCRICKGITLALFDAQLIRQQKGEKLEKELTYLYALAEGQEVADAGG